MKSTRLNSLKKQHRRNRQSGVGALEIAISCGLLILIVAFALDLTILNYAFTVNDAACRDAARAAGGAGNTATSTVALQYANAALRAHPVDGYFISSGAGTLAYPSMTSTTSPAWVWNTNQALPAPETQYVTCTTYVDVRLPIPLAFWGNNFGSYFTSNGGFIEFQRTYTFPIL